jgi:hypothetical protein
VSLPEQNGDSSRKGGVLFGLSRPALLQLCSVFIGTRTRSFRQRGTCIYAWRKQFVETGCLCKGKSRGKPRVAHDTVEAVRRSYMRSPSKSANCASRELRHTPANCVEDSTQAKKMRPYKIQLLQAPLSQLTGTQ